MKPRYKLNIDGSMIELRVKHTPLTAAEVKDQLLKQGLTLKTWAAVNGYAYDTVSCVVRGVHRATYGIGHRIAVQLGMKEGQP